MELGTLQLHVGVLVGQQCQLHCSAGGEAAGELLDSSNHQTNRNGDGPIVLFLKPWKLAY